MDPETAVRCRSRDLIVWVRTPPVQRRLRYHRRLDRRPDGCALPRPHGASGIGSAGCKDLDSRSPEGRAHTQEWPTARADDWTDDRVAARPAARPRNDTRRCDIPVTYDARLVGAIAAVGGLTIDEIATRVSRRMGRSVARPVHHRPPRAEPAGHAAAIAPLRSDYAIYHAQARHRLAWDQRPRAVDALPGVETVETDRVRQPNDLVSPVVLGRRGLVRSLSQR